MNKEERKNLLERMIKANDLMSESRLNKIHEYAKCLIQLCSDLEYNHANALLKYERAQEIAQNTREQYSNYVSELKNANSHSDKLSELMEYHEKEAEALYDASEKGIKYFLGLYTESNEKDLPLEV